MSLLYAVVVGLMFAVALYLLMRRNLVDHAFGIIVMSHAANLFVFASGRLRQGAAPIVDRDPGEPIADPLPQALVLTAIVIGFGVAAFAILLVSRLYAAHRDDNVDVLEEVERD